MIGDWVEKCCPVCGKYYLDHSKSHNKSTCSAKCRHEYYYGNDPDKDFERKIYMRLLIFKNIGVIFTDEELEKIRKGLKDGYCQICKRELPMDKLNIDHDHLTGRFRGILCDNCNHVLGMVFDNVDMLFTLAEYLKN